MMMIKSAVSVEAPTAQNPAGMVSAVRQCPGGKVFEGPLTLPSKLLAARLSLSVGRRTHFWLQRKPRQVLLSFRFEGKEEQPL